MGGYIAGMYIIAIRLLKANLLGTCIFHRVPKPKEPVKRCKDRPKVAKKLKFSEGFEVYMLLIPFATCFNPSYILYCSHL